MGQIKNIKLHIVTDIKQTNTNKVYYTITSVASLSTNLTTTTMAFVSRVNMISKVLQQTVVRRNLATSTTVMDPVQNLFLNKLNEYKEASSDLPEGAVFDAIPEIEEERKFMTDNVNKRYGDGMEEVPKFSWE